MNKMVVALLFSGGLESTTYLYKMLEIYERDEILLIGIDFGQKEIIEDEFGNSFANNIVELEKMNYTAQKENIELEIIDLSYFKNVLSFMKDRIKNEKDHLKKSQLSLFPARNHLMFYSAIVLCEMYDIKTLYLGSAKTDYIDGVGNKEDDQEYLDKINEINAIGKEHSVKLQTGFPYKILSQIHHDKLSKAEEIKYLHSKEVDFEKQVWTCLHPKVNKEGEHIHCGTCKSCVRNRSSFISAGIKDPYEYAKKDFDIDIRFLYQMQLAGDDISKFVIKVKEDKDEN